MQGKKLVFVTNNSTKSRAGYLKKFTGLGLKVSAVSLPSLSGFLLCKIIPAAKSFLSTSGPFIFRYMENSGSKQSISRGVFVSD